MPRIKRADERAQEAAAAKGEPGYAEAGWLAAAREEMVDLEAEMTKHRAGYVAYQEARALARDGKNAAERKKAAARQEELRSAYTSFKRGYARHLELRKSRPALRKFVADRELERELREAEAKKKARRSKQKAKSKQKEAS